MLAPPILLQQVNHISLHHFLLRCSRYILMPCLSHSLAVMVGLLYACSTRCSAVADTIRCYMPCSAAAGTYILILFAPTLLCCGRYILIPLFLPPCSAAAGTYIFILSAPTLLCRDRYILILYFSHPALLRQVLILWCIAILLYLHAHYIICIVSAY